MSLKHQTYKEANIRFLEENLQNEGINELPSGILMPGETLIPLYFTSITRSLYSEGLYSTFATASPITFNIACACRYDKSVTSGTGTWRTCFEFMIR